MSRFSSQDPWAWRVALWLAAVTRLLPFGPFLPFPALARVRVQIHRGRRIHLG